jgi:hypothetical protein
VADSCFRPPRRSGKLRSRVDFFFENDEGTKCSKSKPDIFKEQRAKSWLSSLAEGCTHY